MAISVPDWVKRLDSTHIISFPKTVSSSKGILTQDTLFVGLGDVGRKVLREIKSLLASDYGYHPENIKFLQIDVGFKSRENSNSMQLGFDANEWIYLSPNLRGLDSTIINHPQQWSHWRWYVNTRPGHVRSKARMALFWDIKEGSQNSTLWKGIENAVLALDNPNICIIGSTFDSTGSGILVDLCYLFKIISKEIDITLWLAAPTIRDFYEESTNSYISKNEQIIRTIATLDEIRFFQRNQPHQFYYVSANHLQTELRQTYQFSVVHSVFLFEEDQNSNPDFGVFASMAETLTALTSRSIYMDFAEKINQRQMHAGWLSNQQKEGYIAGVGSHSLRFPRKLLISALSWRMVRDILFGDLYGMIRLEDVDSDGNYHRKDSHSTYRLLFQNEIKELVDAFMDRSVSQNEVWLRDKCVDRLDELMNGITAEGIQQRSDSLIKVETWLRLLVRELKKLRLHFSWLDSLCSQVSAWKDFCSENLYAACEEYFSKANAALRDWSIQTARASHDVVSEGWELYNKRINSSDDQSIPFQQLTSRLGWWIDDNSDQIQVRLLVPDVKFTWNEQAVLDNYEVETSPQVILARIYHIAEAIVAGILSNLSVMDEFHRLSRKETFINDWLESAKPRLQFQQFQAGEMYASQPFSILSLKSKVFNIGVDQTLVNFSVCDGISDDVVTLMRFTNWIPMSSAKITCSDNRSRYQVPSNLYVWRDLQLISRIENHQAKLSPEFEQWIFTNHDFLEIFCLGFYYGIFQQAEKGLLFEGHLPLPGFTPCEVIATIYDKDRCPKWIRKHYKRMIREWKTEISEKKSLLLDKEYLHRKEFEKQYLKSWEMSGDRCENDLAQFMNFLIDKEFSKN